MNRHHMTAAGPIPFTPEEEAARDAEESAWASRKSIADHNAPLLADMAALETPSGLTRRQREWMLANSSDTKLSAALAGIEAQIASKRALLKSSA